MDLSKGVEIPELKEQQTVEVLDGMMEAADSFAVALVVMLRDRGMLTNADLETFSSRLESIARDYQGDTLGEDVTSALLMRLAKKDWGRHQGDGVRP